jgi:hypothetical protein
MRKFPGSFSKPTRPVYKKLHIYHLVMGWLTFQPLFVCDFHNYPAACSPKEERNANSINNVWPTGVL